MLVVTHSSINCFRACHKKYFWKYDQCIKPKQDSWALIDGKAVHLGLEWLYTGIIRPEPKQDEMFPIISTEPVKWPILEGVLNRIDKFYEEYQTQETDYHRQLTKIMLEGYTGAYSPDEFNEYSPEVKGEVVIDNTYIPEGKFILAYKTDARIRTDTTLKLFETKTTSAYSITKFLNNLRMDDQPTTYLYCDRRLGNLVVNVLYNIIFKPRLKKSKFESEEGFLSRIRKVYLKDATLDEEERTYYKRENIYRTPKQLQEFEEETRQIVGDMTGYMNYKSPARCQDWNRDCEFIKLCEGDDCQDEFAKKKAMHEELVD